MLLRRRPLFDRRGSWRRSRRVFSWSFISILEKFSRSRESGEGGGGGMTKCAQSPSCSVKVGNWICTVATAKGNDDVADRSIWVIVILQPKRSGRCPSLVVLNLDGTRSVLSEPMKMRWDLRYFLAFSLECVSFTLRPSQCLVHFNTMNLTYIVLKATEV